MCVDGEIYKRAYKSKENKEDSAVRNKNSISRLIVAGRRGFRLRGGLWQGQDSLRLQVGLADAQLFSGKDLQRIYDESSEGCERYNWWSFVIFKKNVIAGGMTHNLVFYFIIDRCSFNFFFFLFLIYFWITGIIMYAKFDSREIKPRAYIFPTELRVSVES